MARLKENHFAPSPKFSPGEKGLIKVSPLTFQKRATSLICMLDPLFGYNLRLLIFLPHIPCLSVLSVQYIQDMLLVQVVTYALVMKNAYLSFPSGYTVHSRIIAVADSASYAWLPCAACLELSH